MLRGVLLAVLGLAAGLRSLEYFQGQPLWLDEAMLGLNVGRYSFLALLGTLQHGQSAPPLFLWAIEAATRIGGMSEYALRFVPFLAGLLLPWIIWRAARQLAGAEAALIATALAAVSVLLLRYSTEVKPYGTDALVSIALVLVALRIRAEPDRAARWWQLLGAGVAGMAFSFSAIFVLAGCLASLLADASIRGNKARLRRLILLGGGLAGGFAALYLIFYLPHAGKSFMLSYWRGTFLDLGAPDLSRRLYGLARSLSQQFPTLPDQLQVRAQSAAIVLGGLLMIRRCGLPAAAQVVVPFAAFVAGAVVTPYPIAERLQLFLAPFAFIAVGVVIAEALRLVRMRPGLAAVAGVLLVLVWGASPVFAYWRSPPVIGDSREPVRLISGAGDRDPVYVTTGGIALWLFYSTNWTHPDTARLDHFAVSNSTYTGGARIEVIGEPSGMQFVEPFGYAGQAPKPGWAAGEAARIAAVARPSAWLFNTSGVRAGLDTLKAEFARRGIAVSEIRKGKLIVSPGNTCDNSNLSHRELSKSRASPRLEL